MAPVSGSGKMIKLKTIESSLRELVATTYMYIYTYIDIDIYRYIFIYPRAAWRQSAVSGRR